MYVYFAFNACRTGMCAGDAERLIQALVSQNFLLSFSLMTGHTLYSLLIKPGASFRSGHPAQAISLLP